MSYRTFNQTFEQIQYPAGERHVRARSIDELRLVDTIEAPVRNFDDLCEIVTADRLLRRNKIFVQWFLPYFPFARHDRRTDAGDGLEVEVALKLVVDMDLVIADPHSEVTAILPHIPQQAVVEILRSMGTFADDSLFVLPDAGATKKANSWLGQADSVQALKHRDPLTGRLSGFQVIAEGLDKRPCVIVDDICDGGGTFIGLAELLRTTHDAGELTLVVTHGLFTKGLDAITTMFDRIYTFAPTDTTPEITTEGRLITLPYRVLYEKGLLQ